MKRLLTSSTPTRIEIKPDEMDTTNLESETSKILMMVLGVFAALIGIWGIACLISGIQSCENLIDLGKSWFTAVTGIGY